MKKPFKLFSGSILTQSFETIEDARAYGQAWKRLFPKDVLTIRKTDTLETIQPIQGIEGK